MDRPVEQPEVEETIDLHALLLRLLQKRWWVLACVAASTVTFGTAAFVMQPIYQATTVLAPSDLDQDDNLLTGAGMLGGIASSLGVGPSDRRVETALAVLRSRGFTESFITDEKLMPKLFPRKWDSSTGRWKVPQDEQPTLAEAYERFEKIRTIAEDKSTGLITLQVDWTSLGEAAEWANELVSRLNAEMRARAIAQADASLEFLAKELQGTQTVETRDAISRLMEAQIRQRMLADVTQDYSLRVVDKAIATDHSKPIKPRKALLFAMGLAVGLCLAVILFGFLRTTDSVTRRAQEPTVG
jgi:uncharacterized protein involved in exopolysaccharide biosynthesis